MALGDVLYNKTLPVTTPFYLGYGLSVKNKQLNVCSHPYFYENQVGVFDIDNNLSYISQFSTEKTFNSIQYDSVNNVYWGLAPIYISDSVLDAYAFKTTDTGTTILKFDVKSTIPVSDRFNVPQWSSQEARAISLNPDRTEVWVSYNYSIRIYRFTTEGSYIGYLDMPNSSATIIPGITNDGKNMWVATYNYNIKPYNLIMTKIDTTGKVLDSFSVLLDSDVFKGNKPEDIEFDSINFAPKCAIWVRGYSDDSANVNQYVCAFEAPCKEPNLADISVVKTANANNFTTGDVVTYTIAVKNAGPSDAQNVTLSDIVPTQILNPEFSKDGGAHWNPWVSPYNIGTVAAGTTVNILIRGTVSQTAIGTVRNIAKVDSETKDPNPTNNSSTLDVEVKIAKLQLVKSVDKTVAKPGDSLTYSVSITNIGNESADNAVFKDTIPVGTSFVAGSVSINGTPNVAANPDTGFDIGTIAVGATVSVSFTVKVESRPTPPEVVNAAVVDFKFIVDPSRPPIEKSTTSKEVKTKIEIVKVDVVKSADTTFAVKGDTIIYTVIVTNSSTIPVNNVIFKDTIPNGTSFVPGSVTINGNAASGNPSTGINLGTLAPSESVRVSFKVKIDFIPCPPKIINKALVNFEYIVGNNIIKGSVESNSLLIDVGPSSFKQLSREEYVRIPAQKPDVEDILNTVVDIEITDRKVIRTPVIKSIEGQNLTGFKLIVEGVLNQKIEYIASNKEQSVHAAHFRAPFSTFIVLPENYIEGTPVEIECNIEDIYTKIIDKRTIFKNITFMLNAKYFL